MRILVGEMEPGTRLRATREAQGKSLRALARETGVDVATLSRIETNKQRPSLPTLLAIGRALGLRNVVDAIGLFVEEEP